MSFLSELKRRNVIRMAGLYLVVGWLILQVAETVLPIFHTPDWVLQALVVILALAFIPALVFSWVFELTPEGIKRDAEVDKSQSVAPQTAQRMDRLIIVGLVLVVAIVVADRMTRGPAEIVAAADSAAQTTPSPRLAVLPLANFSPDPDNAFFADGLHDDLLTALSRLQGVEVISRTTMQTFRDSDQTVSEIAAGIGATHVIEGSVRRDDSAVRLTVQLIDPVSDNHLWAQTYDRATADALGLQTAVTSEVARALEVAIIGGHDLAPATTSSAAYDLYLKARLQADVDDQLALLSSALLIDPEFHQARAMRAWAACAAQWEDSARREELAPQALADIARARAGAPNLVEIDVADATCVYFLDRDYARALEHAERALEVDASNVEALEIKGYLLRRLGRPDEAIAMAKRAVELDPENINPLQSLCNLLSHYGRYRDAIAVVDQALQRFPRALTAEIEWRRAKDVLALTGDRPAYFAWMKSVEHDPRFSRDRWLMEWYLRSDPSTETLTHFRSHLKGWNGSGQSRFPMPLLTALYAWYLDDAQNLGTSLDNAQALYAASGEFEFSERDSRVYRALYLALMGEPESAKQQAEQAMVESAPEVDAYRAVAVWNVAAVALAVAGDAERALTVLEQRERMLAPLTDNFLETVVHRKLLGDQPRYQAVMQRIADKFEPL